MATDEEWDQDRALTITHEVEEDGTYTMTISDSKTGQLQFAWQMAKEYAIDVAQGIINAYMEAEGLG